MVLKLKGYQIGSVRVTFHMKSSDSKCKIIELKTRDNEKSFID